jgi:hypothetical protein
MSAFNDISVALNQRLDAYATANSRDVAFENIKHEPTEGSLYLRPTVLPADTEAAGIGSNGKEHHQGIFQIDVFAPIDDPKATALNEADSIADYFTQELTLTYNGINVRLREISMGTASRESAWFMVPVLIDYYSFTSAR